MFIRSAAMGSTWSVPFTMPLVLVFSALEEGQNLEYGEDGAMIVLGFNRRLDPLSYIVGTVSDHTLQIGGVR